ncbi:hypothetical protein [Halothiobacillus sp. DCM-1]|uniref:hypothetical protein n=1 Tax=Halothiobacillus sp. DCM-1 TaxID=3112558 RepID=UPI0032532B43
MTLAVLRFLPWRVPAHGAPLTGTPPGFADLMTEARAQIEHFRPRPRPADPAQRAQIDGLITALWLLDGFLSAGTDIAAGRIPRLSGDECRDYGITPEHFAQRRVDFLWRRYTEFQLRRCRNLLQAAAPLGKPWLRGARFRLCIARTEQVLRRLQLDPALAYTGAFPASFWARLTAAARIAWRVLSKRR